MGFAPAPAFAVVPRESGESLPTLPGVGSVAAGGLFNELFETLVRLAFEPRAVVGVGDFD
jgi:hypothetical protein